MKYTIKRAKIIIYSFMLSALSTMIISQIGCNDSFNEKKYIQQPFFGQELKKNHSLLKDGKPVFSLDQAKNMAENIIPLVEAATGKKFKQSPKIDLMNTKDFEPFFYNKIMSNKILNNSDKMAHLKKKDIDMLSKFSMGIYDNQSKIIYLLPQRISSKLDLLQLDHKYALHLSKRVIAHELTHALQDQYIDLTYFYDNAPSLDANYAFQATIEGHALFIETKIGEQISSSDNAVYVKTLNDAELIQFQNPVINQIIKSTYSPYEDGKNFIEYHYKRGGNKILWKILEFPPIDSAMILYPEAYRKKKYKIFNYKNMLHNIYDFNINYEIKTTNNSQNKLDFRIYFKNFTLEQKKLLLLNINHIQALTIYHENSPIAQIQLILLSNKKIRGQILKLLEKMENNIFLAGNVKGIQSWADMSYIEKFHNPIDSVRHASALYTFNTEKYGERQSRTKYYMLSKGDMVVIIANSKLFSTNAIITIATTIFNRYELAIKK